MEDEPGNERPNDLAEGSPAHHAESKRIYQQSFIVNTAAVILSIGLVVGTLVADSLLVAPYVHLAANVGLTASHLIRRSTARLGLASAAVAGVGALLCYPLRHSRGPKDAAQLRRCFVAHVTATASVVVSLGVACVWIGFLLAQVTSSQDLLDLALHTYADLHPVRYAFDKMQSNLGCCGAAGVNDWISVHWTNKSEVISGMVVGVPSSCCLTTIDIRACVSTIPAASAWNLGQLTVHRRGCEVLLKSKFRVVLLFVAIILLILTTMHLSVIIQTARTKPVVVHPKPDGQRTYSHEQLQHIVVRSLVDVRAAEDATTAAKTELTPSTTLPSTGADTTKLIEAAQTYTTIFSTRKSDVKDGLRTGSEKDVRRQTERNVSKKPADRGVTAVRRRPSLASASGHHRLQVVSTTGISALDVSAAKPLGNAKRSFANPPPPPPPSPMFQPPESNSNSSEMQSFRRYSSLPQAIIPTAVVPRSRPRSNAQSGLNVGYRHSSLDRSAAATAGSTHPRVTPSRSSRPPRQSSTEVSAARRGEPAPSHSLGKDAPAVRSGATTKVASLSGEHGSTSADMASPAMMPLGAMTATAPLSQQQPLQLNAIEGKGYHGNTQLRKTSLGSLGKGFESVPEREPGISRRATETNKQKPPSPEQVVHFSNDVQVAGSSVDRLSLASLERAAAATSAIEHMTKTEIDNSSKDGHQT